jgi:protein-tyrosine phosphatase
MDRWEQDAERLEGAVWGYLVGDALGLPYRSRPAESMGELRFGAPGIPAQPPGTWSEGGTRMLASLDALVTWDSDGGRARVRFDPGAPRSRTGRHDSGGPGEQGCAATLASVLPLAIVGRAGDDAMLARWATGPWGEPGGDPLARLAASLCFLLAARLLQRHDDPAAAMAWAVRILRGATLATPAARLDGPFADLMARRGHPGGGDDADVLWSAWEAMATTTAYRDTVARAVRSGTDSAATAALAGGLAGIRRGIGDIPQSWLTAMRGRALVGERIDRLHALSGWRTSTTSPLRVDWVSLAGAPRLAAGSPGALGMTLLPGKKRRGYGGPQWRDSAADARRLREAHGCTTFLLLVEDIDLEMSRAWGTVPALEQLGIRVIRHPIRDMHVPADEAAFRATLDEVIARLRAGERVVVACRGGLGRTGTAVACILVDGGLSPSAAIARVRAARPGTIERRVQELFVQGWANAGARP